MYVVQTKTMFLTLEITRVECLKYDKVGCRDSGRAPGCTKRSRC